MVLGGALIPPLQGWVAESIGYQVSFGLVIACYAYILFFALKGYNMGKIADMKDEGYIYADGELIYKNGVFLV